MEIVIYLYYIIAFVYEIITIRREFISPSIIFVAMQALMFTGILTYTDFSISSDCKLIFIYLLALIMFIAGSELSSRAYPANPKMINVAKLDYLSKNQIFIMIAMIIVSILACLYFFLSSGYNVFLMVLRSLGADSQNFTSSRIALNNVSGVGYIYQFRVIIFPIICAFLIMYKDNKKLNRLGMVLLPIMLIFILGTGQRGGFVMFVLMVMVALLYLYKIYHDKAVVKTILIVGIGAVLLFGLMTIFNGRVSEGGNVAEAVMQRIFDDNQQCAVIAFRYIDTQATQWGRDWFLSFKDLLPGKNTYTQLSYVVFEIMYGSTRGTAPPCIWGSAYYNFGIIGIIIMPFIMGFLYHKVYYKFCSYPMTKLRIFLYAAKFVVLGNWIADTPLVLFNQGFITICIMTFFFGIDRRIKFIF